MKVVKGFKILFNINPGNWPPLGSLEAIFAFDPTGDEIIKAFTDPENPESLKQEYKDRIKAGNYRKVPVDVIER